MVSDLSYVQYIRTYIYVLCYLVDCGNPLTRTLPSFLANCSHTPTNVPPILHSYTYTGIKKKFPSPVRTTGRVIPFRSRLISVRLPFLSVFKPFPFCPTGSPSVLVYGPYGVIKHAQSLIAVISAGRLATVQ